MIVKRTGVKYYTLKEIFADNENIQKMFDDVKNLFEIPISSGYTLFRIFMNKYGNAHLNYPVFVHFTDDECEEVRNAVSFHYLEYRYKYDTLIASESLTYNPLENYRMVESGGNTRTPNLTTNMTRGTTETTTRGTTDTTTRGTTDTRTPNLTKGNTIEYKPRVTYTESDSNTNTESVSAFDADTFANNKKNVISGSKTTTPSLTQDGKGDSTTASETETGSDTTTHTGSDATIHTGSDTTAHTGTDSTTETGSETTVHNLTRYGNIGVTTSQQMIEAERQVADFSALSEFMKGVYNAIMLIY